MKYTFRANGGGEADRLTTLEITPEEGGLRLDYFAADSCFYSPFKQDNEPLYDGCAVELFLAEDGDAQNYTEYEFSPFGLRWKGRITHKNDEREGVLLDTRGVECLATRTERDYRVQAFIPTPYTLGVTRFNAFRIERTGADAPYLLYAAFPTLCETFHVPQKMQVLKR